MIPRSTYIAKILPYVDAPFVKVLTGVRRCGKSTIMRMIMDELRSCGKKPIVHYRFDSMENDGITDAKTLYTVIKKQLPKTGKLYVFFDEIQEVKEWEKCVNSLMQDFDVDIYVTGSNSRMLSSEISTYLTGRYVSFPIYPLSFAEYLSFKSARTTVVSAKDELSNFVALGGFPAVHLCEYSRDEVYTIVSDIYHSTIFSDIVRRAQIRKVEQLGRIVRFVFDNVGRTFSAKSLADYLKSQKRVIDIETVYSYIENLEKAYILWRCSRYDLQGKAILKTQEKFYLADSAMKYAVLGYSPQSVAAMLENVVYMELKRRDYEVFIGKDGDYEIDFVATKSGQKIYVQVCREIASQHTETREYSRLLAIPDNYPKYVLTTSNFDGGVYQGIKTMHVADFLLSAEY